MHPGLDSELVRPKMESDEYDASRIDSELALTHQVPLSQDFDDFEVSELSELARMNPA